MQSDVIPTELSPATTSRPAEQVEVRATIADQMEALASELRGLVSKSEMGAPSDTTLLNMAAKVYSARRKVDGVFGMAGFTVSPAWDIILDLYQAKSRGMRISVTSACIGAACPPTTGLRWLQVLEDMQLIERKPDENDRRRTVVELSQGGKVKVDSALSMYV